MDALIPPPRDDDNEDVYLALQTAKALWSRNEREDALRWLRRAAEQASDANADDRALELFKAAADVAGRMQPSTPPAPPAPPPRTGGPPPPPNRQPVELAPGPRQGGWAANAAAAVTPAPPPAGPPGRPPPPPPRAAPSVPPAAANMPPAPVQSAPSAAYAPPPPPRAAGGNRPSAYDARQQQPSAPPPQPRPGSIPAPAGAMPPQAVPLLRPKVGPSVVPAPMPAPQPRPQPTPAPPPVRAAAVGVPAPRAASEAQGFHRQGSMLGGVSSEPVFEEADSVDDASEVPTRVGKLPPEFARPEAAAAPQPPARVQAPPAQAAPPPAARAAPAAAPPVQQRKTARRRTLNRGEQSPLAAARKAPAAEAPRAQPPAAAAPRGRGGQLPSEVPTEPGNDPRAGAARAAALRALAVPDEEVTAQRDIAMLQQLRGRPFDDLDEDTSVLPGLKIAAARRAAEEEAARRGALPQESTSIDNQWGAAAQQQPQEEDRPTPPDDLSSTSPPDTSRTSTDAIEAAAMDFGGHTVRYAPGEMPWGTPEARGPSPTTENPNAVAQAAAADAAVAARTAARRGAASPSTSPAAGRAAQAPAPGPARPASTLAFRVAVVASGTDGFRVVPLAPGELPPPGATTAMLVATTEAESAHLSHLFGIST